MTTNVTYGLGGYDPRRPDNNVTRIEVDNGDGTITVTTFGENATEEVVPDGLTDEERARRDRDVDLDRKRRTLADDVDTLRQWATDARGTTVTTATAVATLNVIVGRLGTFFDRFADLIETIDQ